MPEPSLACFGFAPPTLTTASAGCGSSGSSTYSSDGGASSHAPDDDHEQHAHHRERRDPRVRALAGHARTVPARGATRHHRRMAVTRGMRYLREHGVPFDEHRYEHRVKGAAYAAEALGLDAAHGREDARGAARRGLRVRARAGRPRALAARPGARGRLALGGAGLRARRPAPDRVPDRRHLAVRLADRAAGVRRRGLARARARRAQRRRPRRDPRARERRPRAPALADRRSPE